MKKLFFFLVTVLTLENADAQNVGIGTNNPQAKLHVVGNIRSTGNLGTDANLFVTGYTGLGIAESPLYRLLVSGDSRFQGAGTFTGDLSANSDLTVGGSATVSGTVTGNILRSTTYLRVDGNTALGGAVDNNFRLRVYDGNTRMGGDAQVTGSMAVGGDLDPLYKLRVYGGDARIGGDFHATGNVGIGNTPDANYKLRVYAGNSRFDGNVNITGNLDAGSVDVAGALTIGGNGSVRSNGSSPLRIGFSSKFIDDILPSLDIHEYTVNIADFTGDNDDVRVMVSQYEHIFPGTLDAWNKVLISVSDVDPVTDTCKIYIRNTASGQISLKGNIYLTVIAKN